MGFILLIQGFYSAHTRYVQEKCSKRINILRMLGCQKTPSYPFTGRGIRNGNILYFNCSDSTLKQIETIQHECLQICAGALRSTPIDCLQHHCNEMPLKIRFYQLCLYYRAHLSTFTDHPTPAVILDSWQERWPENHTNFNSFNMQTKNFFERSEIMTDKHFGSDTPFWLINKPIVNYDVLFNCRKNDIPALNNTVFLEIVNTDYYNFTLLFTDGSKSHLGTSSALFVPETGSEKSIAINNPSSIFSAELYAILTAMRW